MLISECHSPWPQLLLSLALPFLSTPPSFHFSSPLFPGHHPRAPGGQRAGPVWPQVGDPSELLTWLSSRRPRAGAERPEHPAEAARARAQRPALARAPRSSPAARSRSARALGAAARARAALAHPAAAAEAEPDQPHPETARPGPCGDSAGAGVQVMHHVPSSPNPGGVKLCSCRYPRAWRVGAGLRLFLSLGRGKGPRKMAEARTHAMRMVSAKRDWEGG